MHWATADSVIGRRPTLLACNAVCLLCSRLGWRRPRHTTCYRSTWRVVIADVTWGRVINGVVVGVSLWRCSADGDPALPQCSAPEARVR